MFYACAVKRGPLGPIARSSRLIWPVPLNVHQPGLPPCHGFFWCPNLPLCHAVFGRGHTTSRRKPKPPKPSRPPKPSKILKPPGPSNRQDTLTDLIRERYERNKNSSIKTEPKWAGLAVFYAAFAVVTWAGTTFFWLTHSEETPVTGRRRFAHFSAPPSSDDLFPEENFQKLEEIQRRIGPLSEKARKVLKNIAAAAGVDDREWKVYIVPGPGQ